MHAGRMEDDATALAQGMREGSLVPVQVMRDHIERIRDLNPRLCAVAPVPFYGRGRGTRADLVPPAAWREGVVGPGTRNPKP